jgi:cell division protein FtsL
LKNQRIFSSFRLNSEVLKCENTIKEAPRINQYEQQLKNLNRKDKVLQAEEKEPFS